MSIDRHLPPSTGLQNGRNFGLVQVARSRVKRWSMTNIFARPPSRVTRTATFLEDFLQNGAGTFTYSGRPGTRQRNRPRAPETLLHFKEEA